MSERWKSSFVAMTAALLFGSGAPAPEAGSPFVVVLGIAQDAGYPHAGCQRACCLRVWRDPSLRRHVSSLAIVDPLSRQRWIIDATPDITAQIEMLNQLFPLVRRPVAAVSPIAEHLGISGILLTHAHVGHYTGLMYFGREGIATHDLPVFAMPRMTKFLTDNGPWSQLVAQHNIELRGLQEDEEVRLNERLSVTPFRVPHRDELSETVGFLIRGPRRTVVFIPDIDKWERWDRRVEDYVAKSDRLYIDGTFFADGEVPGRSIKEIPHPFISETMARLSPLKPVERSRVHFIHLNHTNPALDPKSAAARQIQREGFHVAREGERFGL
ncbi:MAG TPA: MBL fold metallo-hydrolase [Thermoanaerobaculia bacterium]|nr:MBL fold metallo-hydrolase [Thermoanaerobaculia bacterium]